MFICMHSYVYIYVYVYYISTDKDSYSPERPEAKSNHPEASAGHSQGLGCWTPREWKGAWISAKAMKRGEHVKWKVDSHGHEGVRSLW